MRQGDLMSEYRRRYTEQVTSDPESLQIPFPLFVYLSYTDDTGADPLSSRTGSELVYQLYRAGYIELADTLRIGCRQFEYLIDACEEENE